MLIIHEAPDPCPCIDKITEMVSLRGRDGLKPLNWGSQVECDCGKQWFLQIDGVWAYTRKARDIYR